MSPYYFDYNSTSPLSSSVIRRLQTGEVDFLNPSALHKPGRTSQKTINITTNYLLESFGVSDSHQVFYHSGTTEGINTVFHSHKKNNDNPVHIGFMTDHASVKNTLKELECDHWVRVLKNGDIDLEHFNEVLSGLQEHQILINWTWSHNETGVVWSLDKLKRLKEDYQFEVHIDAAQVVGKVKNWNQLSSDIDYISFSGHKFGALKGVGFTFYQEDKFLTALIQGGGQQDNLRSGTVNTLGIVSLPDALEESINDIDKHDAILEAKSNIVTKISQVLGDKGEVICQKSTQQNNNTFFVILYNLASDRSFPFFDQSDLIVGRGAACSSGAKKDSETLVALDYEAYAANGIRFSFQPAKLLEFEEEYTNKIIEVFESFL